MKMKTRNRIIIGLAIIGIALFAIVQFYILPQNNNNKNQYIIEQQNPSTHDLNSILQYKNKYMGNISNLSNLYYKLPLNNVGISYRLFPDKLAAEINYKETEWKINEDDKDKVNKVLIYNSTAAFALIDNLEEIDYNFTGSSYKVTRSDAERWYGVKLSALLDKDTWKNKVQNKLEDENYIKLCSKGILLPTTK